jgi:hypothetical protein
MVPLTLVYFISTAAVVSATYPVPFLGLHEGWDLELPTDKSGKNHDELEGDKVMTYSSEFMKLSETKDSVLFMCPSDGAKSAHGGARTELKNGCETKGGKNWNPWDKEAHWFNITASVNEVTNEERLTVYQMHGKENDLIKIQYKHGQIGLEVRGGKTVKFGDYPKLGAKFTGAILVENGKARFWFEGKEVKAAEFEITGEMKKLVGECSIWHFGAYNPCETSKCKGKAVMEVFSVKTNDEKKDMDTTLFTV